MDFAFESRFTTRSGTDRPELLSFYPGMYEEIDDTRAEARLCFSIPVPLNKLYDYVSFYPSMTGLWRLEDEGKTAVFTPSEEWQKNSRYEIRISASFADNNGMNIRKDFTSIFTTSIDREEPVLLSAGRLTKSGKIFLLEPDNNGTENSGWEKDDRLSLVFSKPVDGLTLKNFLTVEGASSLVMENEAGYREEFIFHFETIPVFESRFTLRIKPGIKDLNGNESKDEYFFRVFADGKSSKPPEFAGIRMPMAPGNGDLELASYGTDSIFDNIEIKDGSGNYPSGVIVHTWIELYFSAAEEADIDIFSVMELFRVETSNNVLTFSPRQIKKENFSVSQPHAGWESFQRLEVAGTLTNSTNFGIVSFQIASGLKDSLNNKNDKLQRISLIK
jgi:hypothetical protein